MAACTCGDPSCGDCVPRITDAQFVQRAVHAAGSGRRRSFRWVQITAAFALGSGFARKLCERFKLDPDELVGDAPETLGELAVKLEQAKPDPIAELLAHLAERAGQIDPGAAFHGGPLDGASRYNVAQAGIREIVAWDFQRRKPFTDDCMGCGGEGVLCAEQGATGYPLCLDCYFQAVTELEPRAGDEPRALWPVRWNTEVIAHAATYGKRQADAQAAWFDSCEPRPDQRMGTLVVMRDGEPDAEAGITYMTAIVDDVDDRNAEALKARYQANQRRYSVYVYETEIKVGEVLAADVSGGLDAARAKFGEAGNLELRWAGDGDVDGNDADDPDDYDDSPNPAGGWDPSEPEGWDNSTGKE